VPKSHNKKRNVGIVYELLLRRISQCLIEGNNQEAQKTLNIISKRFKKGTELYKEFRLFRALAKSSVSDTAIAAAIITEAKSAARKTNTRDLNKEKSMLIREMNHTLDDSNLYRRFIPDYKNLATIQVLLNDWRDGESVDIERMAKYESQIITHLIKEKNDIDIEDHQDKDIDSLVVKIMTEKINKKYSRMFDSNQRDLIKEYAFSIQSGDSTSLRSKIIDVKRKSIEDLDALESSAKNETISKKISNVREKIVNESVPDVLVDIDDTKVTRFLTLIDMSNQIRNYTHGK